MQGKVNRRGKRLCSFSMVVTAEKKPSSEAIKYNNHNYYDYITTSSKNKF